MAIQTLTGNEFEHGSAIDNTQTDQFILTGASNIVEEGEGNIKVTGVNTATFGPDTGSTVMVDGGVDTSVVVNVHGSGNSLVGLGDLSGSTVTFNVSGLGSGAGGNAILLNNHDGTTTTSLAGPGNIVTLNSDATNSITTGSDLAGNGNAVITIGAPFDDVFGSSTTISMAGSGNTVSTGDANTSVAGGTSNNKVALGDGENSVSLSGTKNTVSVGGGDNTINAGGDGAVVNILGIDGASLPAFVGDIDDPTLADHPADSVTIAGTGDKVTATYEDVTVNGLGVTSAATVLLGDGNNTVLLGGKGGDTIVVGNGFNHIHASGNLNTLTLGDGLNQVVFSGNGNKATVKDTTGVGNDSFQLQAGMNDVIALGMAGGAISGTAITGVTTITQSAASKNQVVVNLVGGTGAVTLGNGQKDSVTANGNGSVITVGNGNDTIVANGVGDTLHFGNGADTVTAGGPNDKITGGNGASHVTANGSGDVIGLGNGANTLTANGDGDKITLGNGANHVQANGIGDVIKAGSGDNTIEASGNGTSITATTGNNSVTAAGSNETITLGSGNNNVTALGSGDTIKIAAISTSVDSVAMGSTSTLTISGGTDKISMAGAGDTVSANNLVAGSQITGNGNGEMVFLGGNSSTGVHLNPVGVGEQITVQALDATGTNTGNVQVSGFGLDDTMNLNGLGFTTFLQVLSKMTFTPTQDTLHLSGGGSIAFDQPTAFSASEFKFSTTHGLV